MSRIKIFVTLVICLATTAVVLTGCMGRASNAMSNGGELVGVRGSSQSEATPYGMVAVSKGSLKIGLEENDTLWGADFPRRDISVDGFWMDQYEVSNAKYRQFVNWVRDSIIRERLADPAYGGDETFKIEEDKNGDPVTPHLNWNKPIPNSRKATEDEMRAIESVYTTHPIDGTRMLDARQMNYRYEVYDYAAAAQRRYRLNPEERDLNTDHAVDTRDVMISKDTAWVEDDGRIVRQTITRPLSGPWDFLNTYIVNIYPDTTCWVNDFKNADNERYMKLYFSNPAYDDYPVVGVTWEQANAFCAWRTEFLMRGMGAYARQLQRFRLPTEIEWEYAARGKEGNAFPWESKETKSDKGCFYANFKPDRGNYTKDGSLITSRCGIFSANSSGLYDMAGNVAEWTSTVYTEAGVDAMSDMNPELKYNAAIEDPYRLKKKSVRGGSWKDPESMIRSAWRAYEYQNQPRSFIGFRCVRSMVSDNSRMTKKK
jgi:formylglycine-generating enzyme required for sulfatase activity